MIIFFYFKSQRMWWVIFFSFKMSLKSIEGAWRNFEWFHNDEKSFLNQYIPKLKFPTRRFLKSSQFIKIHSSSLQYFPSLVHFFWKESTFDYTKEMYRTVFELSNNSSSFFGISRDMWVTLSDLIIYNLLPKSDAKNCHQMQ